MAYISVDVDLADLDDTDLIQELRSRGYKIDEGDVSENDLIRQLYDLFHLGKDAEALALIKPYICDQTGRVL